MISEKQFGNMKFDVDQILSFAKKINIEYELELDNFIPVITFLKTNSAYRRVIGKGTVYPTKNGIVIWSGLRHWYFKFNEPEHKKIYKLMNILCEFKSSFNRFWEERNKIIRNQLSNKNSFEVCLITLVHEYFPKAKIDIEKISPDSMYPVLKIFKGMEYVRITFISENAPDYYPDNYIKDIELSSGFYNELDTVQRFIKAVGKKCLSIYTKDKKEVANRWKS